MCSVSTSSTTTASRSSGTWSGSPVRAAGTTWAPGDIPRVRNGLGMAILSTSAGVLSDRAARDQGVGGELLALVW